MNLAYNFNKGSDMSTSAFSLPFLHNVGLKIETAVDMVRKLERSRVSGIISKLEPNYKNRIETYKSKMLDK
jgi:hypothetical protein